MRCQQQDDGNSCGIFAFAFAILLAAELNPSEVRFQIERMRQYLIACLLAGDILPFPDDMFTSPRSNVHWRPLKVS